MPAFNLPSEPLMSSGRRCAAGFTLIELLVVISIVAVLASMLLPAISMVRSSAQSSVCMSNLRQIGIAHSMYADDADGLFVRFRDTGNPVYRHWYSILAPWCDGRQPGLLFPPSSMAPTLSCPAFRGHIDATTGLRLLGGCFALNPYLGSDPPFSATSPHNVFDAALTGSYGTVVRDWSSRSVTRAAQRALILDMYTWHPGGGYTNYNGGIPWTTFARTPTHLKLLAGVAIETGEQRHAAKRANVLFCDLHVEGGAWDRMRLTLVDPASY